MGFKDQLKRLDAKRLQQTVKATVQSNGRLTFAADAVKEMDLSEEKSIIIFAAGNNNLGAALSVKGDEEAFELKRCGAYFYVNFKNYLQECAMDYKKQKFMYDITCTEEKWDNGQPLWKFDLRVLPREPEMLPVTDDTVDDGEQEAQETPQNASDTAEPPTVAETAPSVSTGVSAAPDYGEMPEPGQQS